MFASCGGDGSPTPGPGPPTVPVGTALPSTTGATTTTATALPPTLRVLALGDSFTSGEGVPADQRWPDQLAARLGGLGVEVDVDYVAGTSWTSHRIWRELSRADVADRYDLVTVQAGVNDQFLRFGLDAYRRGLDRLLAAAVDEAGGDPGRVLAISIADWTETPRGRELARTESASEIAEYGALLRDEVDARAIVYADITALSGAVVADDTLVASDGLHFSGTLYGRWVDEVILPLVLDIVRRDG